MKNNQNKKNFFWNIIGLTFNSFNSLFFLIIVNRVNGIKIAGMFTYGFAIACLLWGISMYYNRVYQVSNNEISDINFIKSRLLFCLIMLILSILIALVSTSNIEKIFIIILLCLFRNIEALDDSFYGIIHKNNYLDYIGKSLFIKAISGLLLFSLVDVFTRNIILSILILIFVNIIGAIIDYNKCKKYIAQKKEKFIIQFKIIVRKSFPIFISSFLSVFLLNCQKYVIGFTCDEEIQTLFGIIIMPATIMCLCGQYLINPFLNVLTDRYRKKNIIGFKRITIKLLFSLFFGGIIISGIALIIATPVMNILYNLNLEQYNVMISLIIVAATFYSLSSILSACLTIMKKNNVQLFIYFFVSIISVIISLSLIRKIKIDGAVFAYLVIMILLFIIYLFYFEYYLRKLKVK